MCLRGFGALGASRRGHVAGVAVAGEVVWGVVHPAGVDSADPRSAKATDGVRVVAAAVDGMPVHIGDGGARRTAEHEADGVLRAKTLRS